MASIQDVYGHLKTLTKKWFYDKTEVDNKLSNKESTSNKTTTLSSSSTNTQYPSAKVVFDAIQDASTNHTHSQYLTEHQSLSNYYNKSETNNYDVDFILGTQTASTSAWTGTTSVISSLRVGTTIFYKLPYASTSTSVTLNLTLKDGGTTGAKNVFFKNTSRVTTHFGVGQVIGLTYDGTAWYVISPSDNNSNNDNNYGGIQFKAGEALTTQTICCAKVNGMYYKVANGVVLDIRYPLIMTSSAVASGTTTNAMYRTWYAVNIANTKSMTLTNGSQLFLEGTAYSDGKFTISSNVVTHTLTNGRYYINVGTALSTTQIRFISDMTIYYYNGTTLKPVIKKEQIVDFPIIPSKTSDLTNDSGFLTSHQSLANYVTTSDSRLSDSRTPIAHATSATTYGVSSASNYGHAMASSTSPKANGTAAVGSETAKFARGDHVHPHSCVNNLTSTSTTTPLAANQGKVLNNNKIDKNDFNVDYVHSFIYNSSIEKYAYQGQSGARGIGVSAIDENDNSLLNENGVAIIDLVFQNTNINYGSIQLVLAEADGRSYSYSGDLSNTQTIATITDTNKHHITIVVSPDTHIEEQSYDYYDLKVSKISYDGSNITVSSGKTSMEEVGVYFVFNGAIGGNIEYMNVIKRTPIVNQIIDIIYPIGSTYISVNSVNPSFLFGGEWEQIQNRFLLASGSTYSAGSTGGSADAVVVSHSHTQNSHSHEPSNTSYKFLGATTNIAINGTKRVFPSSTNGSYHYVYAEDATGGINEYETTSSVTPTINSNGVSGTGKNMPPYLTVYMWKRIA